MLLVLIIVAPWRQVRDEPPMDKAVEAKLLLHRNPDEPTGEVPRVTAVPPDDVDDEDRRSQRARRAERSTASATRANCSGQVTAKNMRASHVVSPSTRRPRLRPATACAQPLDVDHESELVAGAHEAAEAHLLDATEERELARVAVVTEQRDRARLRERFELDHARERSGCPGSGPAGSPRRR